VALYLGDTEMTTPKLNIAVKKAAQLRVFQKPGAFFNRT